MSIEQLRAFAQEINRNPGLAELCASDAASDADDQARIAKEAGFDVHPSDLVSCQGGALVENVDEDFYMRSTWWKLMADVDSSSYTDTVDFDGDGIIDAVKIGGKWVLPSDNS